MIFSKPFPPDIAVLDHESILFARLERGRKRPQITRAKSYALGAGAFALGVTPSPENRAGIAAAVRRMKGEQGRLDGLSLLLPDSWFRIAILELATLPSRKSEADEMVRWTLKRTLPIRAEDFRIAWQPLARNGNIRLLVVAAMEKSLAALESIFREEGIDIVLIEPVGMNIWNSIAAREGVGSSEERLFFYLRNREFTTAVFRGTTPLFVRSRNLNSERTLVQEIQLSASYLRNALQIGKVARCHVAGNRLDDDLVRVIAEEFSATASRVSLADYADCSDSIDWSKFEGELTACTGVFTV